MEKFLEIITNPYLYIFLTAFIIMGLTQLIKFIIAPVYPPNTRLLMTDNAICIICINKRKSEDVIDFIIEE